MKKKLLSLMLAGAMVATVFAGCSSSTGADKATEGDAAAATEEAAGEEEEAVALMGASDDDHTLTVAAWDANFNIPALQAAEAAYQQKDPDFKLKIQEVSASSDVENAVTLAGASGDYSQLTDIVLFQDHYINKYMTDYPDAWQALTVDADWKGFSDDKLSYSTFDGKHYGMPVDNGASIFAYRTDVLEQAGYTIDDFTGITWEKWLEQAKVVKEKTGYALLSMDHNGDDLPYMMMQAEGQSQWKDGKPNLVGNDTFKSIIEVIVQGAQDGTIILANDWSEYTDSTIIGDQVAGVFNGNWIIATMKQNKDASGKWAITTIPTLSGKEGYAANGGSSLYITSNSKHADLASDFLAYTFGGGDGAIATYDAALTNGGVISCYGPAGESDLYNAPDEFFGGVAANAQIVEMGTHVPAVEQSDYHYPLREKVGALITNVINGNDIDSEIQSAQEQMEFEMDQ